MWGYGGVHSLATTTARQTETANSKHQQGAHSVRISRFEHFSLRLVEKPTTTISVGKDYYFGFVIRGSSINEKNYPDKHQASVGVRKTERERNNCVYLYQKHTEKEIQQES